MILLCCNVISSGVIQWKLNKNGNIFEDDLLNWSNLLESSIWLWLINRLYVREFLKQPISIFSWKHIFNIFSMFQCFIDSYSETRIYHAITRLHSWKKKLKFFSPSRDFVPKLRRWTSKRLRKLSNAAIHSTSNGIQKHLSWKSLKAEAPMKQNYSEEPLGNRLALQTPGHSFIIRFFRYNRKESARSDFKPLVGRPAADSPGKITPVHTTTTTTNRPRP